jgi:drug/metabolite transporter (DMT)-like permease
VVVLLGLAAAVLLATGFVLQQHEAAALPTGRLGPALLLRLVRRPVWLGGIAAMVGGQLLGAAALGMGSLVVVEPLLATNVLFALPMAAVASRRRLSRGDWAGALMLVAGLALFLLGGAPRSAVDTRTVAAPSWVLAGAALVAVVVLLLVLGRGRDRRISAALTAGAAGIVFGAQDFLTQRALVRSGAGVLALLASWPPWVLVVVAVTGLTLAQRAFGLADLSASLPPITLDEPLCGIALSAGILGAALPHRALELAAAAAGLSLMIAGVVILTRSPLVVGPRRTPGSRSSAADRRWRGHGAG